MPFAIPQPIKELAAPLAAQASRAYSEPKEGKLIIPIELDWDGNGSTYQINVQGRTTQPFSQIIMLDVDNSQSGADVTFYFPDTTDTLVVPAYSAGLFPVFTNGLLMYVAAPMALASDITRFRALNYLQNPVSNPAPEFHDVASQTNIAATGTTALIVGNPSGTLVGYSGFVTWNNGGVNSSISGLLKDHATNDVIDGFNVPVSATDIFSGQFMNVAAVAIRFAAGIDFVVAGAVGIASFSFNISLKYRSP